MAMKELGPSGRAIWDAYEGSKLEAGHQALVLEYARCADVADKLNGLVTGRADSWVTIVFDEMGEVHLSIDKVLDQAVKNQGMLRTLHAEIRQANIKAKAGSGVQARDEEPEDMLSARRREKEDRERQHG